MKYRVVLLTALSLTLLGCGRTPISSSSLETGSSTSETSSSSQESKTTEKKTSSKESEESSSEVSSQVSSSSSSSSTREQTPEEKLYSYVSRNGGNILIARVAVEQTIWVACRLNSSLMISGSGEENKQATSTYSVTVKYTFSWMLTSNQYTCVRQYHSSNWQTNEQVDETTTVTAYITYKIGGSVSVQRYSTSGASRWENTVKTAMDSIARDCAKEIGYIV